MIRYKVLINKSKIFAILLPLLSFNLFASKTLNINVNNDVKGAPITIGIPFPIDELESPDHVRLIDLNGNEIPSQVTEVSRWQPSEDSIKWIWVFFFSKGEKKYLLEISFFQTIYLLQIYCFL